VTPEQLAALVDQHAAALVLLARTRCDCAEDVVQEALIALAAAEPPPDEPRAWLFQVVRRRAVSAARSAARRRKHEAQAATSAPWFNGSSEDRLDAQTVTAKLLELDETARETVVLKLWGGLTFREISGVLETSSSTAQRNYETAIQQLRKKLSEPCPTTPTFAR
jgi:RNA polymerase sigma-70 factor (ECF subfamily)